MEHKMGAGTRRSTADILSEIEDLRSKVETIHGRISEHQREMTALQGEVAQMEATRRSLLAEVERRSRPAEDVHITDHALLRYVERVFGIDVDAVRRQILTDGVAKCIELGASTITVNGIQFRVKDRSIVTVIGSDQKTHRKKSKAHHRGRRPERDDINAHLADYYNPDAASD
jgi:predicted nuclease with TOPRIM domain